MKTLLNIWKFGMLPLFLASFFVLVPASALAQSNRNSGAFGGNNAGIDVPEGKPIEISTVKKFLIDFLNFSFGFVGVAAAIVLLYGGYQLLIGSAKGDEKAFASAKNLVIGAIVAMAIAFGAGIIVNTVYNLVTEDISGGSIFK